MGTGSIFGSSRGTEEVAGQIIVEVEDELPW
jgi:hypothetical protein